jgi:hypothetical protein
MQRARSDGFGNGGRLLRDRIAMEAKIVGDQRSDTQQNE